MNNSDSQVSKGENNKQSEHKSQIFSHEEAVNSIIEDVKLGSGKTINREEAEKIFSAVNDYSYEDSSIIREAYNNPNAPDEDRERMSILDDYINNSTKWEGTVYRGIHVSPEVANNIISQSKVDMLGPASWSSELDVAKRFSHDTNGDDSVSMIFVLPENKSGSSIAHISRYGAMECEVLAPSGVLYDIVDTQQIINGGKEYIYVYVDEAR